jgi:alcohol dehydrogenase
LELCGLIHTRSGSLEKFAQKPCQAFFSFLAIFFRGRVVTNILVIEPVEHRRNIASKKGVNVIDPNIENFKEEALGVSGERGFDKIIEMVGFKETLQAALDLIRAGGTIAALGVFTDQEFNLAIGDVFLRDISLHMNGFANVQPYMKQAMLYIQDGVVNPDEYFTHEFKLDNIDKAFELFYNKSDNSLKILIKP